jgi:paraquat-inducible protein A
LLPVPAEPVNRERLACPDCGLLQRLPVRAKGHVLECGRCGRVLVGPATGRVDAPLALSVAALLLLIPAYTAPLLIVSTFGAVRETWLPSAVFGMWRDGFPSLGLLIAAFSIVLPILFLTLLIRVLVGLHRGRVAGLGSLYRWIKHLRPWVMIEVYLVGGFVAYSRIKVVANVDVAMGGWCLIAATLVLMLAITQLDDRTVWEALPIRKGPERKNDTQAGEEEGSGAAACTVCDLIAAPGQDLHHCARCGARLHRRKPDSMRRTAAFVIAGYLLYIPANVLPVLTIVRFGREDRNTILSGVMELVQNHLLPLAVIVFAASIVLPLVKLFSLTWMLVATRVRSRQLLVARTRLYRAIDLVGRWSNIDVYAVATLVAILQFGALTAVHSGNGMVAFAAVVILTMVATSYFDPRLMWDVPVPRHD